MRLISSALSAGNDIRGALIGPGVSASHGQERTHIKGLEQTWMLLAAYVGVLDKELSRKFFEQLKAQL